MAYIGQDPVIGRYILVDQISGGFNGTASGFTLAAGGQGVLPGLAQNVLLSLGGVIQRPGTDYTISGSGLTFTTPPLSGTTFFATVLGDVQSVGTPSDGTVLPASIASSGTFPFPAVTIGSGTVSAPSLAIAGNVNTGLYSPGANQLALTASGVSRLAIDASGKVGINAATPSYTLDVRGTGPDSAIWGYNIAQFVDTTANNTGFRVGVNTSTPGLTQLVAATTSAASQFGFWTYDGTNWGERVRIDGTGRVGIGVSNVSGTNTRLEVSNDSAEIKVSSTSAYNNNFRGFRIGVTGDSLDYSGVRLQPNSGELRIEVGFATWGGFQTFYTNGLERLRINTSGNIGIGTSSPQAKVEIVNTGTYGVIYQPIIYIRNISSGGTATNSTGLGAINWNVDGNYDVANIEAVRENPTSGTFSSLVFRTNPVNSSTGSGVERMRIDSSGNVGIGGTPSIYKFDSVGNGLSTRESANSSRLVFGTYDAGGINYIAADKIGTGSYQSLAFQTGGTERLRIDSSGRLLVGTSSARNTAIAATNYQVLIEKPSNYAALSIYGNVNTDQGSYIGLGKSRGTTAGAVTVVQANDILGYIGFEGTDGTNPILAASIQAQVDGTPGANDMPGRLVFSTTADGASSPTERMRISQAGLVDIGNSGPAPTGAGLIVRSSSTDNNTGTFQVRNTNTADAAASASFITGAATTTTSNVLIRFGIDNYNTGSGQINANGSGAAAFGTFSDERLKENITLLPSQWKNIKSLRPVEFDYIESFGGGHQVGFIAQEIQTVYPDAVGTGADEMLTVTAWSKTEARLVRALQEALERIETLEAEVAALKAQ